MSFEYRPGFSWLIVVLSVLAAGCDSPLEEGQPPSVVHSALPGGMLFGSWSPDAHHVFFVGGAAPSDCFPGTQQIIEYDGSGWRYLRTSADPVTTTPSPVDMGASPSDAGGCACQDGGTACAGTNATAQTFPLRAVYGFSLHELFAAGDAGQILRIMPERVEVTTLSEHPSINAMWGSSADDLWAVGGIQKQPGDTTLTARAYYFNGTDWRAVDDFPQAEGTLRSIWGARADRVWAVGQSGLLFFFDGRSWTLQPTHTNETLVAVHGLDDAHVWAVGGDSQAVVLQADGRGGWQDVTPKGLGPLLSLMTFPGGLILGGRQGLFATGTLAQLKTYPLDLPQESIHTIVPYGGGVLLAGGNLFAATPQRDQHGLVMSWQTEVDPSFTLESPDGGFLAGSEPSKVPGGLPAGW